MSGPVLVNESVSIDEEMAVPVLGNESVSVDEELAGHVEVNEYVSIYEALDHNCETTSLEDFPNQPRKKSKCCESIGYDDQLQSPTMSTTSLLSECPDTITSESDDQKNNETLPLSPSPTMVPDFCNEEKDSANDAKKPDEHKQIINDGTYDYLPQDYTLTEQDECAHCLIQFSKEDDILVKIDDISIAKRYLSCLLDTTRWLDDEVISGYICCLKETNQHSNNDAKVYFENPFVTRLLKQDGRSGIHGPTGMTNVVKNYLNHDMVHLPINIKNSHWYLASVNFEMKDIQVHDSMCWV